MKRHRKIAALCALIALVLSFAESARAAVCQEPVQASHEHHGNPEPSPSSSDNSRPDCPLGMAWQAGCAPAASLPAHDIEAIAPASATQTISFGDVVVPRASRASAIFHPPRF